VVVALHSFTPAMGGVARPWPAGVLYGGGDERFARAMLARLRDGGPGPVGDNEPYAMSGTDYTIPRHCFSAGRPYVEVEIRQDLLETEAQVAGWAGILEIALLGSLEVLRP
jgi:predicted N-formylglutamate amidohydrolase